MSSPTFRRSVSTASAMPGYWTLIATSTPSGVRPRCTCPIEAAAIASGSTSAITRDTGSPHSFAISALELVEADARRLVAQLGEALLDPLGVIGFEAREVHRGEHLAELHRRALHLAELHDDLLDNRGRAPPLGSRAGVVGPHTVQGAAAGDARALAGHQPAHLRGAPDAGPRRALVGHLLHGTAQG